ncbi:phosphatase PAP2 family protein [Amycolatopsis pigmentata]|uniref:Phosphatase PAP2 family protein n=1 Tax=Amycolatopsis pigmentata TaxID=450801 RepID=A0ABW5FV41_9PSEU
MTRSEIRDPLPVALDPRLRRALTIVALAATLVVITLGTLYFAGGTLGAFDNHAEPLAGPRPPWHDFAVLIDFCGEPIGSTILTAGAVAACLVAHRVRMAVLTVLGVGLSVAATALLKPLVGRTIHGVYLSFPSGHTAFATALALLLALLAIDVLRLGTRTAAIVLVAMVLPAGAAMGWTEVVVSAHYPTDTVGGFCTALAVVPATAWLMGRVRIPRR